MRAIPADLSPYRDTNLNRPLPPTHFHNNKSYSLTTGRYAKCLPHLSLAARAQSRLI